MCGISGFFDRKGIDADVLKKMNFSIKHRGPDGEGFCWFDIENAYATASVETPSSSINASMPWSPDDHKLPTDFRPIGGFGHRRLAILDLEAGGHQPICSADKRFWITYNGEIYNHEEIREELRNAGYFFYGRSDSEVVLNAFIHWGKDCLLRFNGMWAFAIYDRIDRKVFAARDRFGVKPFYYSTINHSFVFASEQKALLQNPYLKREINEEAVFDYFVFGQIEYEEEGFFKNILELKPSHCLQYSIENSDLSIHRYYELPYRDSPGNWDEKIFQQHAEEVEYLLTNAIKLRLKADVEIGSCLSGGLDSSAIVGIMRSLLSQEKAFHVFTATFPGKAIDEGAWANEMAGYVKAIEHTVEPNKYDLMKDLDELTICQDIPIWSTSTYAQFRVMKLVKDAGIKAVLDGQGGDELFAGYAPHLSFFWKELDRKTRAEEMRTFGSAANAWTFHLKQQTRFDYIFRMPPKAASWIYRSYFPDITLINKGFYEKHHIRFALQRGKSASSLNQRLASEMQNTSLKGYLKCEDRCAMWHGIESRTPFSDDYPLIEKVFSLPSVMKIHSGQQKILLRQAVQKFVPQTISKRKDKLGYATPNNEWLEFLSEGIIEKAKPELESFLNLKKCRTSFKAILHHQKNQDTGRLFKYISFINWYKNFF